jgi:voltage-gated potassium channel
LVLFIVYRLRRLVYRLARRRMLLLLLVFAGLWLAGGMLFYEAEGPGRLSLWDSLYWALITMATVGYGDIVPTTPAGRLVASLTAVFGIATYSLLISTLADAFLEATVKAAMGMGRLRGKRVVVVGEGPICDEAVRELEANGLAGETGWLRETQPRGEPPVDYVVGGLDEEGLQRAGVGEAEHVIICYEDDSRAIHAAALARKLNPRARLTVLAKDPATIDILRIMGVDTVVPIAILGRLLASSTFEPGVTAFVADATTARGGTDLVELRVPGKTVGEVEESTGYRAVAIVDGEGRVEPAEASRRLREGERLIALRGLGRKKEEQERPG